MTDRPLNETERAARAFVEHVEAMDKVPLDERAVRFPLWRETSHELYDQLKRAVEGSR